MTNQRSVKHPFTELIDIKKHAIAFILCSILFCLSLSGVFQKPVTVQAHDLGHKEQIFTADDGLPTTSMLAITQTPDGFIWLGGYGGLSRYDGKDFVSFGTSYVSNVADLLADKDGSLWIASLDNGLVHYKDSRFYFYDNSRDFGDSDEGLYLPAGNNPDAPNSINTLAQSPDGKIYFNASKGVGYLDDQEQIHWIQDDRLGNSNAQTLVCDAHGNVWAIGQDGNVYSCAGEVTRIDLTLENDRFRSIAYDEKSDLFYLGSESNTVLVCDDEGNEQKRYTVAGVKSINSFGFYTNGRVCVGSDDGISTIEEGEITPRSYQIDNSIEDVFVDIDGNIWFASSRQGVLLITEGRFQDISLLAGLPKQVVNTILSEGDRLYIGHDNGFEILNEETFEIIRDENYEFLDGKRIRHLYLDQQGRMWVCTTGDGLYMRKEDGAGWEHYCQEDYPVLQSNKFRCVIESAEGIVAASDSGCYVINDEGISVLAEEISFRVLSLVEVHGVIYAGTDGNGIYVIEDGKVQDIITTEDGLSSMRVLKMKPCSNARGLWIAAGNNLDYLLFETGKVRHSESFPPANVLDALVTNDTVLWVMAGNGIFQTTEAALLRDENIRDYRHYTRRNGIPYDIVANSFPAVVGDHAYLCGSEGVIWMDMDASAGIPEDYLINVDYIDMDGKQVYVQGRDTIEIPANTQRLEIQAHLATYTQENPTVFYYLGGFETGCHYTSYQKLSSIVYTNIPGGNYVFHFGVYDPDTSGMGQELALAINVEYKWYERHTLQIVLVIFAVVLIIFLTWIRFRITDNKERQLLEQRFSDNEQRMLKQLAYTDYLTGLYNRNYLNQWISEKAEGITLPLAVIGIDCNNLKLVNDQFGHAMGDDLLKSLADLLNKHFNSEKTTTLRIGGDEFLILAEDMTQSEAENLLELITNEAASKDICSIPLSFCYGISMCENMNSFDLEKMVLEADEHMIFNKQIFHSQKYNDTVPSNVYIAETKKVVERHIKNDMLRNMLYEAFAEASDYVYIYALDLSTNVSRWSRNCVEFFGLPSEYMVHAEVIWGEHVHPDDREYYMDDLMQVLTGKKEKHDCQYRALNRFNEYIWVECKGSLIRGVNGKDLFSGMMTRLDNQSIYDPLTGLKTKNQFYDLLPSMEEGIVFLLGVDYFKEIISIYGYENGDKILVLISKKLSSCCDEEKKLYRFNGDEFIFTIPHGTEKDIALLFDKIKELCSEIILDNGVKVSVSLSGGAAYYSKEADNIDQLVNQMELTLEYAKNHHKNSYVFYSSEILAQDNRRRLIKKELRESIDHNFKGFELYYQPLLEKENARIIGCEALLRWKGTEITDSGPGEFISILEENDAIIEVGRYVMQESIKQQKVWEKKYGTFLVSFNVSYLQFLVDGFVQELINTAKKYDVDPHNVVIELTESRRVQAPNALADIFSELQSYGFHIVLDDFGTGYASLEMLKKLPCNGIKIEHSFVRELSHDSHGIDYAIIRSILLLCHETNQTVIVEGVETAAVDAIVRNMNVTYLQGYYYSRPVCITAFEELVAANRGLIQD